MPILYTKVRVCVCAFFFSFSFFLFIFFFLPKEVLNMVYYLWISSTCISCSDHWPTFMLMASATETSSLKTCSSILKLESSSYVTSGGTAVNTMEGCGWFVIFVDQDFHLYVDWVVQYNSWNYTNRCEIIPITTTELLAQVVEVVFVDKRNLFQ